MDYLGLKLKMAFGYNDWDALVSDESRGIESIEYDNFGNPVYFDLKGRDYTKNVIRRQRVFPHRPRNGMVIGWDAGRHLPVRGRTIKRSPLLMPSKLE